MPQSGGNPISFTLTTQLETATSKLCSSLHLKLTCMSIRTQLMLMHTCVSTGDVDFNGTAVEQFSVDPSIVDVFRCFDFPPILEDSEVEGTENLSVVLTPLEQPTFLVTTQNVSVVEISDDNSEFQNENVYRTCYDLTMCLCASALHYTGVTIGLDTIEATVEEEIGSFQICASLSPYEGPLIIVNFTTEDISAKSELCTGS